MIIFRICNVEAGETQPVIQPRAYYKAFLAHVNRRNQKSRVRVSTKIVDKNVIKTAYIYDVDASNMRPMPDFVRDFLGRAA